MKRSWNACIITSIICKLLALLSILGFVFAMVWFTNNLNCLWLLFLLLAADIVPTYEFKSERSANSEGDTDVNKSK